MTMDIEPTTIPTVEVGSIVWLVSWYDVPATDGSEVPPMACPEPSFISIVEGIDSMRVDGLGDAVGIEDVGYMLDYW